MADESEALALFVRASMEDLIEVAIMHCEEEGIEEALGRSDPRAALIALLEGAPPEEVDSRRSYLASMGQPTFDTRAPEFFTLLLPAPTRTIEHRYQEETARSSSMLISEPVPFMKRLRRMEMNQERLDNGELWQVDTLGHEQRAMRLHALVANAQHASIITLEGGAGTGRSDVMGRMARFHNATWEVDQLEEAPMRSLWLDPWLDKTTDITRELLLKCVDRAVVSKVSAAADLYHEVDRLSRAEPSGVAFARMVDILARLSPPPLNEGAPSRLLVFIDDIDRCHPGRQVELLEELHALTAAAPHVAFIITMDSAIVANAFAAHYELGDSESASWLYLDKIIDMRLSLPPVPTFGELFDGLMARPSLDGHGPTLGERTEGILWTSAFREWFDGKLDFDMWRGISIEAMQGVEDLTPRIWQRVFELYDVALGDEPDRVASWLAHPAVLWPWMCLRVLHRGIARQLLTFFSRGEDLFWSSDTRIVRWYLKPIGSLALGLERYTARDDFMEKSLEASARLDEASTQLATLLVACGFHGRNSSEEVRSFLRGEYKTIKTFEESCDAQGLGSVMRLK